MKYAIFIDIDGTLLSDSHSISNRTKNIIHNIVELGHNVVLCTGRPRIFAERISKEIGASSYIISSNGAEIYDYKNNKIIYISTMPKDIMSRVISSIKKNNARITMAIDNIEYIVGSKYNTYQENLPAHYNKFFNSHLPKQAMIIGNEENLFKLRKIISSFKDIEITSRNFCEKQGMWFSIIKKGNSKGNGIKKFCNYFNIDKNYIISIGNDYNDIEMFEESKISIAVANAVDDIKGKASFITDSNNDDGVAKALEKLYLSIL